ncbi:patatin-like phospholipase family protein [Cellulomonas citrea]|uniref:patatin-like phospholipase family protein n=1 Tax=Cellulomonas citrea TaxID=1909423 RepID=UPI001F3533ED|nr:patatin-like phospholipase family protein [Cellulomonas citrea]
MSTTPFSAPNPPTPNPSGATTGRSAPPDGAGRRADHSQVDATHRSLAAGERALVLGGGGSTGNAWLIGVLAGLLEAGLDVTGADLTVGTSAGSTAAAQLTGAGAAELLAAILDAPAQQRSGPAGPDPRRSPAGPAAATSRPAVTDSGSSPSGPVTDQLERTAALIAAAEDPADMRRRLGAAALDLEAASDGSYTARWRATVAARLPGCDWPRRTLLVTAVDARTGAPVLLDRDSGVDLVDAVAASCASGLPYRVGDVPYLDGGYRSGAENADLAAGHARVLVLSPLGGRTRYPLGWGLHLAAQVDRLRADGSRVETLVPDASTEHLFGINAMNPSLRAPAAQAGHAQGLALAERVAELWL